MQPVLLRKAVNRTKKTLTPLRNAVLPYEYPGVRLTPKRVLNYWHARFERNRGVERVRAFPTVLTIEATNVCNLRCPACFTGASQTGREKSMLQMPLYDRLLGELGDRLLQIEFYNWGEPLLNKNLFPMIRKAADRGIATIISSNLSFPLDDARAEELVASGLHVLGVSVDGATQPVYEQYRVRGDIALVFENVRKINAAKKRLSVKTPQLVYEYHMFSHNLHEIGEGRRIARELGMQFYLSKGWVAGPDWDPDGKYNDRLNRSPGRCHFLWDHAVVHNDGGVAPCCATFYREDDYGTVAEPAVAMSDLAVTSFRTLWNNERFRTSRRMFAIRPEIGPRPDLVCYDCPVTKGWRGYRDHLAAGNSASSFQLEGAFNDGFNYFFSRRPARATSEGLIPITDVTPI
jgi:MoaA/NifB/PqqE/SkfB family radical SAM enzyme